jgi:hypothetical protein
MLGRVQTRLQSPKAGAATMTKKKNNQTRNEAGLSRSTGSHSDPDVALDRGTEAWEAAAPFPGSSVAGRKYASVPKQFSSEEMDEHLILSYLAMYRLLERSLVQAGFTTTTASYKRPRPDWYRWARHIEKGFNPGSSEELEASVEHLVSLRDEMEQLPGRRQNRIQWESASSYSDILWLTEMLQQTNLQLTHRYNLAETPGCDTAQVMAALLVVGAWLQLVPGG